MARTPDLTKLQAWQKWLEQLANSKQSPKQFCDSIGCSMTTFYYWKRRCDQAALPAATASEGTIITSRTHRAGQAEPLDASAECRIQSSFLTVVVRAARKFFCHCHSLSMWTQDRSSFRRDRRSGSCPPESTTRRVMLSLSSP